MKRFIIPLCLIFLFVGCAGLGLNNDKATEVIVNILSRRLAFNIIKNNPSHIDEIAFYCKAIQGEDITQAVINTGVDYLTKNFGNDPLLKSDLKELSSLIVLDVKDPSFNPGFIRQIAKGFLDVIELLPYDKP